MNIQDAIAQLDPLNNDHWTTGPDGLPSIKLIRRLLNDTSVTRKMITDAEPELTRSKVMPPDAAPDTDPAPDAKEQSSEYILHIPLSEVFASEKNMTAFQSEANAQCLEWRREIAKMERAVTFMSNLSAKVDQHRSRQKRGRPNSATEEIREFQKSQQNIREKRIKNAQAFVDQGIRSEDLADIIDSRSPLDKAFSQRRPAPVVSAKGTA